MKNKEVKFREIISENEKRILGICSYYANNEEDVKDLYQEVLINIWKSLNSFRGDSKLSTWIYRIAVNTSVGFIRKEIRRQNIFLETKEYVVQNFIELDPKEPIEKEKLLQMMEAEINNLSVIDKIIITLVLESVNYKEIATVIGMTEPNVRTKVHRIKNELKNALLSINY